MASRARKSRSKVFATLLRYCAKVKSGNKQPLRYRRDQRNRGFLIRFVTESMAAQAAAKSVTSGAAGDKVARSRDRLKLDLVATPARVAAPLD